MITTGFLILFSFVFMGFWEFTQSPFYTDISDDFNEIVFFRLHCTAGDVLILFEIVVIITLINRSWKWLLRPKKFDYLMLTLLGVFYTAFSEYLNVQVRGNWGYSKLMPVIPLIDIGLIPIIQWIFLPVVILSITRCVMRGCTPSFSP